MMETSKTRGRGIRIQGAAIGGRVTSKNRKWVASQDGAGLNGHTERWERGNHRRKRGIRSKLSVRTSPHLSVSGAQEHEDATSGTDEDRGGEDEIDADEEEEEEEEEGVETADPETPEDRERFWQELVKAREVERKKAIAEGKMDDPNVKKRLDEAITMVGTCADMCPRFERYRRERENNLDKWEVIPGTKRVDHKRAVKIYERAAGDKTLPSDLRPPPVLRKTLDYLFHDLLVRGSFSQTYEFIRDRSRAVRSDFTMQHESGPLAIECHDRCARFHILALHLERDNPRFSVALEEQQLMNTLQSLKEFYEDQRGRYQAPTELEMRVYHRLIHIRDQRERHEEIPEEITSHPVFQYTTQFRLHVQAKSAPITKNSRLTVDAAGMEIFGQLAAVLRKQNNVVMIYLVACILERLFGKETIEDIEAIRGDLSISDIIDGISAPLDETGALTPSPVERDEVDGDLAPAAAFAASGTTNSTSSVLQSTTSTVFGGVANLQPAYGDGSPATAPANASQPLASAFGNLTSTPNVFGTTSVFPRTSTTGSVFGSSAPKSVFGSSSSKAATPPAAPISTSLSTSSPSGASSIESGAMSQSIQHTMFSSPGPFGTAGVGQTIGITGSTNPHPSTLSSASHRSSLNPSATPFTPPRGFEASSSVMNFPSANTISSIPSVVATDVGHLPTSKSLPAPVNNYPRHVFGPPSSTASTSSIVSQGQTSEVTTQQVDFEPSTKHLVDRRQTLWDIPSSSFLQTAPQTQADQPSTPTGSLRGAPTPVSPVAPPPLYKIQPISLPPTPTARWFDPSSQSKASGSNISNEKSALGFPALQIPTSRSAEMLSPLQLPSPGSLRPFPASNESPSPRLKKSHTTSFTSTPGLMQANKVDVQINGRVSPKGKDKETPLDLNARASEFLRKSLLVKKPFKLWKRKTTDRAAWSEAIRRSDTYSRQVQRDRFSNSLGADHVKLKHDQEQSKRRRVSSSASTEVAWSRRTKRRVSAPYVQPLTDEELARRLKENHEEHERRWALGSFLGAIRSRVKTISPSGEPPLAWHVWLSMNPENDGTAIWLQHKFDVPASGNWISENVFSIPVVSEVQGPPLQGSPGFIIFERTPLEGIGDDIERKYRILDDCARLRDVVQRFPSKEELRFLPSLLVINWVEEVPSEKEDAYEFANMTTKLVSEGLVKTISNFAISSTATDLDRKFQDLLATINFDIDDKLLVSMTWKGLVELFVSPFKTIVSDWLDGCWHTETLDWFRYGHVLQAIKELQSQIVRCILTLLGDPCDVVVHTPVDLEAPPHLGQGYMLGPFLDALANFSVATVERVVGDRLSPNYVLPKADIKAVVRQFEQTMQSRNEDLRRLWISDDSQLSPKRRATEEEPDPSLCSGKRFKSNSASSAVTDTAIDMDGSPTAVPASTSLTTGDVSDTMEKPQVTVAMLRALARDVFKTYGRTPQ
ncbi:hypothetical protein AcW1_002940 [Taiwanofungus camphoratus]|nr:hypothetical protein AcW1_002940 [Antrodia cinnamomea]